jgi:hypothetical protein
MSVQNTSVVDFVSLDDQGGVILTISDHLAWTPECEHFLLLQEKINTYCKYIENGQIYDEYPQTRDRRPLISVVFFHDLTPKAEAFLQKVKAVLVREGFDLEWKKYQERASS